MWRLPDIAGVNCPHRHLRLVGEKSGLEASGHSERAQSTYGQTLANAIKQRDNDEVVQPRSTVPLSTVPLFSYPTGS